jgi:hypothetical protein
MSGERTITGWATGVLQEKLSGLSLGDGVATQSLAGGWVSGEVSVGERKGKSLPIYSLEVELPWEGTVNGTLCRGTARLPDVSLEMLDDLEVDFSLSDGGDDTAVKAALEASGGAEAIRAAVRDWAAGVRKAVSENLAGLPLDPPSQARTPRAAALISEEEAMSAGGAAVLDEADADDGIEEIPHPDDAEGGGDHQPFTEEEVDQMYAEAKTLLSEAVDEKQLEEQLNELDSELKGRDLQERGQVLVDVLNYLEGEGGDEEGEEGEEGQEYGDDDAANAEPYPGPEGLEKLWTEVVDLCAEEDVPRLEEEVKGKAPEDQWKILLDVRAFLLEGDEEEMAAFDEWRPSLADLSAEWRELMTRVPPEEAAEVEDDFKKATPEEKKRMVWDVRKFLDENDGEEGADADADADADGGVPSSSVPAKAPPRPPTDAELGGRSEVRRRGGATRGREYEARMECGFDGGSREGREWDEYYAKEVRNRKTKRSPLVYAGACLAISTMALGLTALALADEEESVVGSALRLLRLG